GGGEYPRQRALCELGVVGYAAVDECAVAARVLHGRDFGGHALFRAHGHQRHAHRDDFHPVADGIGLHVVFGRAVHVGIDAITQLHVDDTFHQLLVLRRARIHAATEQRGGAAGTCADVVHGGTHFCDADIVG